MRQIKYAGGSFVTDDAVAEVLVEYAAELARAGSAEAVSVPVWRDHRVDEIELLVGPASQILVEPSEGAPDAASVDEFGADTFVDDLRGRIARIRRPHGTSSSTGISDWEL
jgi:hypothetical protein